MLGCQRSAFGDVLPSSSAGGMGRVCIGQFEDADPDPKRKDAPPGQERGVIGTECIKPAKLSHRSGSNLAQVIFTNAVE